MPAGKGEEGVDERACKVRFNAGRLENAPSCPLSLVTQQNEAGERVAVDNPRSPTRPHRLVLHAPLRTRNHACGSTLALTVLAGIARADHSLSRPRRVPPSLAANPILLVLSQLATSVANLFARNSVFVGTVFTGESVSLTCRERALTCRYSRHPPRSSSPEHLRLAVSPLLTPLDPHHYRASSSYNPSTPCGPLTTRFRHFAPPSHSSRLALPGVPPTQQAPSRSASSTTRSPLRGGTHTTPASSGRSASRLSLLRSFQLLSGARADLLSVLASTASATSTLSRRSKGCISGGIDWKV